MDSVAEVVAAASEWWWLARQDVAFPDSDVIASRPVAKADEGALAIAVLQAAGVSPGVLAKVFASVTGDWKNGCCGFFCEESWRMLAGATGKKINLVSPSTIEEPAGTVKATYWPDGSCELNANKDPAIADFVEF